MNQINQTQDCQESQINFGNVSDNESENPQVSSNSHETETRIKIAKRKQRVIKYPSSDEEESDENKKPIENFENKAPSTKENIIVVNNNNNESSTNLNFVFSSYFILDEHKKKLLTDIISELSGNVVKDISSADVFIAKLPLIPTHNILLSINLGKPIVSEEFLEESRKAGKWLSPFDFIIKDAEFEEKKNFVLKDSILSATKEKVLSDYSVYIYSNLMLIRENKLTLQQIHDLIKSAGGEIMDIRKRSVKPTRKKVALLYNQESKTDLSNKLKMFPNAVKIHDRDLLFNVILPQKVQASTSPE